MADTVAVSLSFKGFQVLYSLRRGLTRAVHALMGRGLGVGESVPFESFRHMEAFRSSSRAAIGRRSDAHFLYWQGRLAPPLPHARNPGYAPVPRLPRDLIL